MIKRSALLIILFTFPLHAAYYTLGDIFRDTFYDFSYEMYKSWEQQTLINIFGIEATHCTVSKWNSDNQLEVRERPGLSLCLAEHIYHQLTDPKRSGEIVAYAKLLRAPSQNSDLPIKIKLRPKYLPTLEIKDAVTLGASYIPKLRTALMIWKNSDLELEFGDWTGQLKVPLSHLIPQESVLFDGVRFFYNTNGNSNSQPMITKIIIQTSTLDDRPDDSVCTSQYSQPKDSDKLCFIVKLFGASMEGPALELHGDVHKMDTEISTGRRIKTRFIQFVYQLKLLEERAGLLYGPERFLLRQLPSSKKIFDKLKKDQTVKSRYKIDLRVNESAAENWQEQ